MRNKPCVCGSGLKFKKCCQISDLRERDQNSSQKWRLVQKYFGVEPFKRHCLEFELKDYYQLGSLVLFNTQRQIRFLQYVETHRSQEFSGDTEKLQQLVPAARQDFKPMIDHEVNLLTQGRRMKHTFEKIAEILTYSALVWAHLVEIQMVEVVES